MDFCRYFSVLLDNIQVKNVPLRGVDQVENRFKKIYLLLGIDVWRLTLDRQRASRLPGGKISSVAAHEHLWSTLEAFFF